MHDKDKAPFIATHRRPKRGKQESMEAMKLADTSDGRVLFRARDPRLTRLDETTITSAARFAATFEVV